MQAQCTDTLDAMPREDLGFRSCGTRCAAWFYPARGVDEPAPIVVMAHGLSGTRRDGLGPFAQRFAQAGIAALLFDHRGFGDSAGEPDLFHPRRQLEDWIAAIAFARSLEGIDPKRVATFGSSMGGGNALAAAALDKRIAAAISQVPFLDMVTQAHRSSLSVTLRMLSAAVTGRHMRAIGQPSEPAFINAPGGEEGWLHVVSIGEDSRWRDRVSSRWLLGAPYRPIRHARRLCTAPGSSAWERRTEWLALDQRSALRGLPRRGSCAPIRASITSTSTTGPRTSCCSPTRSSSSGESSVSPPAPLDPQGTRHPERPPVTQAIVG